MRLLNARVLDLADASLSPATTVELAGAELADEEELDLEGRILAPGLWDHHVHMDLWAQQRSRHDVSAATSAAHCSLLVGQALAERGASRRDELLVGRGFRDAVWADSPSAELLDRHSGATPVVLLSGDLHAVWLNTAALRLFGIEGEQGHLVERDAFEVEEALNQLTPQALDRLVDDCLTEAAALGVVGITDMEQAWTVGAWRRRSARPGGSRLRVRAAVYAKDLPRALAEGLRTGDVLSADGLVTMGPLKVIGDGSLTARTALCHQPYPHGAHPDEQGHGVANVSPAALTALMGRAYAGGIECAIHAIGDAANSITLDVFEATGAAGSIEHAQLVSPDDVARMARLGVVASVQPNHLVDDASVMDVLWHDRAGNAFPLADMARQGVRMRFGSDAPVSALQPWQSVHDAVTRRAGGTSWHPEQCLDLSTALLSSSNGVSRVRPGDGDAIVLEHDPFQLDAAALPGVRSVLTVVAGRVVHRSL